MTSTIPTFDVHAMPFWGWARFAFHKLKCTWVLECLNISSDTISKDVIFQERTRVLDIYFDWASVFSKNVLIVLNNWEWEVPKPIPNNHYDKPPYLKWMDLLDHSLHSASKFWVWGLTFPSNNISSTSQNNCRTFCALAWSNS